MRRRSLDLLLARLGIPTPGAEREQLVSDYFASFVDSASHGSTFALRQPTRTLRVFASALGLPRLTVRLAAGSAEADEIRSALTHKRGPGRLPIHQLSAVLALPARRGAYALGPDRQTVRRQARKAGRLGVTWGHVPEPERADLLDRAVRRERDHPMARYRHSGEETRRLFAYRRWLVARNGLGQPLLLSVTPSSGEWAALTYFRTLADEPAASAARYLMTQVLVDELVADGVRYLADSSSPIGLPNGLRHFQRMLGFRIFRIAVVNNFREKPEKRSRVCPR